MFPGDIDFYKKIREYTCCSQKVSDPFFLEKYQYKSHSNYLERSNGDLEFELDL